MTGAVEARAAVGADWRYTARPEWSSAGESMWMRLAKFSLCNRLSVKALAALFAVEQDDPINVDLRCADRWNAQALANVLEISADDVRVGFCAGASRAAGTISPQLRCCSACLEAGFHAAWFQSRLVKRCPLHDQPLRMGCVRCAAPIPYALGPDLAACPLLCASCGCAWVPGLSRPAGRCTPLGWRSGRLMRRWAMYVEHAISDGSHRPGKRSGTPAVHSPSARPHPLTTVNRLFDAPPPQMADVLLRRHPALPRPVPQSVVASDRLDSGYEAVGWPHFGHFFARCEHALRKARGQFFNNVHDECGRGGWRHLLNSDLMTPADAMDRRTAAALGWSVTWMSSVRVLAPEEGFPTPALGLAGWLACLPILPRGTPTCHWQAQVLAWLEDDLALSARMWSRVAAFMRAKGTYVFQGAIVNLPELAQRHRVAEVPVASLCQERAKPL